MTRALSVAILGGGSFGTAISNIVASNGHKTWLWMRDAERAKKCMQTRENPEYLPGYKLHDNLNVSADLVECTRDCDIVVISVPSKSFREVARKVSPHVRENAMVISTTKGIEAEGFYMMSQVLQQEMNNVRVGVLSGPNFAQEIIQNQYTGTVIASTHQELVTCVQKVFSSSTFRVYSSNDPYGVELGGVLKNIYAIVSGLAKALGCGHNTIAMLLTRGLAEMSRMGRKLGAQPGTFLGLAGMGDLILTCSSDLSRNYRVGYAVGSGKSLEQAVAEIGQVAEGVNTLKIVKRKADDLEVYMPMVNGLYAILFEGRNILEVVQGLMTGEMSSDVDLQGGL